MLTAFDFTPESRSATNWHGQPGRFAAIVAAIVEGDCEPEPASGPGRGKSVGWRDGFNLLRIVGRAAPNWPQYRSSTYIYIKYNQGNTERKSPGAAMAPRDFLS